MFPTLTAEQDDASAAAVVDEFLLTAVEAVGATLSCGPAKNPHMVYTLLHDWVLLSFQCAAS